jgi:hypothetical protein
MRKNSFYLLTLNKGVNIKSGHICLKATVSRLFLTLSIKIQAEIYSIYPDEGMF